MKSKLDNVKLTDIIVSDTNEMFRDEMDLTPEALKELIDSIREKNVIQPVLLRYAKQSGKYILVAGERRYRSSLEIMKQDKKRDTIPAYIRDMTDEEAFELQVTENLQRKDVHPLREAHAYKYLVDKDPQLNTIAELALRFGKTEHYITTRLKLNDLIAEAKKDFADGLMSLGHALLIARLTPDDQANTIESCTDDYKKDKNRIRVYHTVSDLEDHINDSVICNLNTAAFNKDDATLLPKAGACTICPKRSGANQLFNDMIDKDRCFDRACFMAKRLRYMATQIPVILEKTPDIVFLQSPYANAKVDTEVAKALKEHKVKVLKSNEDFDMNNWSNNKTKITGIWINGNEVGKKVTVYSTKAKAKEAGVNVAEEKVDVKEAIKRIDERLERSNELDEEKVYARILEAIGNHPTQQGPIKNGGFFNHNEDTFLTFILWDKLGFIEKEEVGNKLSIPEDDGDDNYSDKLFKRLTKLTADEKLFIIRKVMFTCYGGNHPKSAFAFIIRKIAEGYGNIPIKEFEAEQQLIREKREENAAKRKRELQPKKEPKKEAKKAATKPDKKIKYTRSMNALQGTNIIGDDTVDKTVQTVNKTGITGFKNLPKKNAQLKS